VPATLLMFLAAQALQANPPAPAAAPPPPPAAEHVGRLQVFIAPSGEPFRALATHLIPWRNGSPAPMPTMTAS
jgi:hypothetical protein